jgi:ribosome-binding factor A
VQGSKLLRVNDDIQRVLSVLLGNIKDPRIQQGMISVTRVDTTGDLRFSKIYLSIMGNTDEKELKKGLKSASGWLRRELGRSLSLRHTPELIFELDHSIEHGAHIDKIISSLNIGSEDGESLNDE